MFRTGISTSLATLIAFGGLESTKTGVNALTLHQAEADDGPAPSPAQTQMLAQTNNTGDTYKSVRWDSLLPVTFTNESLQAVELFWLNYAGNPVSYGQIAAGASLGIWTFSSHPWCVTGVTDPAADLVVDGFPVFIPVTKDKNRTIRISETYQSITSNPLITVTFENKSSETVTLSWHDSEGELVTYATIAPGGTHVQGTFPTHPWSASGNGTFTTDGHEAYIPVPDDDGRTVYIYQSGSEVPIDSTTLPTVTGGTGTIFLNSNWVAPNQATEYEKVTARGSCVRNMFDRRTGVFANTNAWCFDTQFKDETKVVEIQVNRNDFTPQQALNHAEFYGEHIGKLPKLLRRDVQTVWIHDGLEGFGGGNNNLLIHTQQGDQYIADGILDETFIHEGAHTSLDAYYYGTLEYNAAVAADQRYISNYARDNPQREDIAETYLVWFATRYAKETFSYKEIDQWNHHMENRFEIFDKICYDMSPYDNYCVF